MGYVVSKDEDESQEDKSAGREMSSLYTVKERDGPVGLMPKVCHHGNHTSPPFRRIIDVAGPTRPTGLFWCLVTTARQ
jgi:hypothetical protein